MNPVTFNDVFTRFLAVPTPGGKRNRLAATPFQKAPLFEAKVEPSGQKWTNDSSRELVIDERGLMRLPFPVLRASLGPPDEFRVGSYVTAKIVLFEGPCPKDNAPCNWLWAATRFHGEAMSDTDYLLQVWFRATSIQEDDQPAGAINFEAGPSLFNIDKKFLNLTAGLDHARLARMGENIMMLAGAFLFDVNSPANHIAKVGPAPEGRSLEWLAAREHYVILDRRHAANKAEVVKGATVAANADETLERIAHSRRAHWRYFKSDKFVNKKGTRKWIRSIWVGPPEWKDQGGSVYKLIR